MNIIIRKGAEKESTDIRGIVFRLVVFIGLLFAISVILEGCAVKKSEDHPTPKVERVGAPGASLALHLLR